MSASGPRVKESAVSVQLRQGTEERMRKDGRSIWSVFGSVFGGGRRLYSSLYTPRMKLQVEGYLKSEKMHVI